MGDRRKSFTCTWSTLRLLLSEDKEDKDTFCWPCLERGKKEIKLVSSSQPKIDVVIEKIKMRLFTTTPVLDGVTCYDSRKSVIQLCFQPHKGYHSRALSRRPQHTLRSTVYDEAHSSVEESDESMLEKGISSLKLESSTENASYPTTFRSKSERLPPSGLIHKENLLFVRQCIFEKLQKLQSYEGQIRLEARIGKLLWTDVPPEIASSEYDILEFEADIVSLLKSSFSTYISTSSEELTSDLGEPSVLDTYDFKLSSREHRRLDLRLAKTDDGHLDLYAAYKNEVKVFVANWVFLEGHHDVRLSLNTRDLISKAEPLVQEFAKTIKISRDGQLSFEIISGLRVDFIRHKIKSSYLADDLCVEVAKVEEFNGARPKYESAEGGTRITADFASSPSHYEIELQNLSWFAEFSSSSPNTTMEEFFNILKCPIPSKMTPPKKCWTPDGIVSKLPHFMEMLECVVDSLKPSHDA
ncbi:uncharacterized protein [Oscarella lobularis]|uniref:uncharacterized protein isoform X2 n=1 Tax=Oscarella lobularis TaxID=121494 RepID=UPI0033135D22